MSSPLPKDSQERKDTPVYAGVLKYFPRAIAAVAQVSKAGNDQHNPGTDLHWDRDKSGDELDALTRHLMEAGTMDTDGIPHSAKVAWRALANLEKELEQMEDDTWQWPSPAPTFHEVVLKNKEAFGYETKMQSNEPVEARPLNCTACWMSQPAETPKKRDAFAHLGNRDHDT